MSLVGAAVVGACATTDPTPSPPPAAEVPPAPTSAGQEAQPAPVLEPQHTPSEGGEGREASAPVQSPRDAAPDAGAATPSVDNGDAAQAGATPPDATGADAAGPLTDGERISRFDDRLQRGLGEFDGLILREQQSIRDRAREQGADLPDPGDLPQASDGDEGQAGERARTGGDSSVVESENQPDVPAGRGAPATERTAANIPPDIPDGSDDDVVARQIREAAMRETDPELRKKLWDEYRKYKNRSR